MEIYTALLADLMAGGALLEEALVKLRIAGATPVDTIKAIRIVQCVSLGEAKRVFVHSPAWVAEVKAGDVIHHEALTLLGQTSRMSIGWASLTCKPSDEAVKQLAESWGWMLREPFAPVLFSALGDVFLEPDSGGVWWLNTGVGELMQVAESVKEFRELLGTAIANEWFMPSLIERLQASGKILQPGQCYTYVTLPVFAEGKYDVENVNPGPAHEHFGITGHILGKIKGLPDGAKVKISVTGFGRRCGHEDRLKGARKS